MKFGRDLYLLLLLALSVAGKSYDTKYETPDIVSNIDSKSLDAGDLIEADSDVATYSSKKHPKVKEGSVTEIRPARGGAKDIKANSKTYQDESSKEPLVEEAPPYMSTETNEDSDVPKLAEDVQPIKSVAEEKLAKSKDQQEGDLNLLIMAASMIVVSEIGDKTFLIAALMAMRSPRLVVFSAAASALILMTILSGIVGHALPALIPERFTKFLASLLFLVFGYKLFREGMEMSNDVGVGEEMAEVEEEIALSQINAKNADIEEGDHSVYKTNTYKDYLNLAKELLSYVLSPTWIQVFAMTFLGEWGDRSQIATIAMAAGSDYWFVILGGCVGHTFCTAIAVVGGMLLASRISMKQVTLGGAVTFVIFALLYLYEAIYGGK